MNVAILLATYNGERYLSEQLDSILSQSYSNFTIFISDDCSSDKTKIIISEYMKRYPSKIVDIGNTVHFGSAKKNFINLLFTVESDLFLFCDQDDIWSSNHVEKLISCYNTICKENDIPILIHSDLTVVDSQLQIISKSFFRYSRLPKYQNKRLYFIQNNVTGCTCLINKQLKDFVFQDEKKLFSSYDCIPMHDLFFAIIASYFGRIIFLDESLIQYRQHENNSVGAKSVTSLSYIRGCLQNRRREDKKSFISFFCDYFNAQLSSEEIAVLHELKTIENKSKFQRCLFLIKNDFIKTGISRKLYQLLTI